MDTARWQRLRTLFDSAADARPADREALLASECGDDVALREEVSALLASIGDDDDAFERGAHLPPTTSTDDFGRRVGPYRLLGRIGHGGMGAVYEAVRADETFEKRVAIKFIRPGFGSDAILRRFRRERQILAAFEHPNVARLLDAGSLDGQPYLVMELVDGQRIDEYCAAHALSVRARLSLFLQLCAAVQYAHRNLVLHRDLKPSNVLVTSGATVKLLDFGVARLVDGDDQSDVSDQTLTDGGVRPLTPEYASPEQLRDETLSLASDVYSLGILLYELLAGRRPFVAESRSPAAALVERGTLPAKPSATVTPAIAALAGDESTRRMRRRLRGELDNIVLKALRTEPARRYQSVEQLADDVSRYLDGRPVLAQPDSAGYRAGKFIGRHRGAVAAAALAVLALVVGSTVAFMQARRAERERMLAQKAQVTAERTSAFLQHILSAPDVRWYRQGRANVRVSDVLDDAVAQADTALKNEPAAEAMVRRTIGRTYGALGRFADAETQLRLALAIDRRISAPKVPDQARDLHDIAGLRYQQGDWRAAEPLFRASYAMCSGAAADTMQICYTDANDIGVSLSAQGFSREAEPYLMEAVRRSTLALGRNAPGTDVPLGNVGNAHAVRGDFRGAEIWYRRSLAIETALMARGHEPINRALTLTNLAGVLLLERRFADAAAVLDEARASNARTGNADTDVPVMPLIWASVAELARRTGHFARADSAISLALAAKVPANHPYVAAVELEHGRLYLAERHPADAERVLARVVAIDSRALRRGDPRTEYAIAELGIAIAAQGRTVEARGLLASSAAALARDYGLTHPRTLEAVAALNSLPR